MPRRLRPLLLGLAVLATAPPAPAAPSLDEALARADAAWARRSDGHEGPRPAPTAARRVLEAAEAAAEAHPESLAARWRLLRALFFRGEFAAREESARRETFERATRVADAALADLAGRLPEEEGLAARLPSAEEAPRAEDASALRETLAGAGVAPGDAARLHFWAAIAWGGWSRVHGLLGAVREGAAGRVHEGARVAAALEPGIDRGGPLRLLARLHADLPKVPLLTGWVDRDRAVPLAERALALAPDFAGNRLTLALTLLDAAPARRDEARALLEEVADLEPAGPRAVELAQMRETARTRLDALGR